MMCRLEFTLENSLAGSYNKRHTRTIFFLNYQLFRTADDTRTDNVGVATEGRLRMFIHSLKKYEDFLNKYNESNFCRI